MKPATIIGLVLIVIGIVGFAVVASASRMKSRTLKSAP